MASEIPEKVWGVRLPAELLRRWKAFAKARSMSAKQLTLRVMTTVLDGADSTVGISDRSKHAATGKLHIQLLPAELDAVKKEAARDGYSLAGWVAELLKARITAAPIFTGDELEALSEASRQLAAVGINLNTAVHLLHRSDQWLPEVAGLAAVVKEVRGVAQQVRALTERAIERGNF